MPPDLTAVKLDATALTNHQKLWALLTSPETAYLQRRAAGVQGATHFPLTDLPRLGSALSELRREETQHHWGMQPNRMEARPAFFGPRATPGPHHVLGHLWTLPKDLVPYPLDWDQEGRAPWPWQAHQALRDLLGHLYPRNPQDNVRWLDACLALPCTTDEEAQMFIELSQGSSHVKTPAVLARWRVIALDPRFPVGATRASQSVGQAVRLWDAPLSQSIGEVITDDILRHSPHRDARHQAAFGLAQLGRRWRDGKEIRLDDPASGILRCLELAQDPTAGDAWTRLYVYGFSACEAMSSPPFACDRRMDSQSPEVGHRLAQLAEWLKHNRTRLQAQVAAEQGRLREARRALDRA